MSLSEYLSLVTGQFWQQQNLLKLSQKSHSNTGQEDGTVRLSCRFDFV